MIRILGHDKHGHPLDQTGCAGTFQTTLTPATRDANIFTSSTPPTPTRAATASSPDRRRDPAAQAQAGGVLHRLLRGPDRRTVRRAGRQARRRHLQQRLDLLLADERPGGRVGVLPAVLAARAAAPSSCVPTRPPGSCCPPQPCRAPEAGTPTSRRPPHPCRRCPAATRCSWCSSPPRPTSSTSTPSP